MVANIATWQGALGTEWDTSPSTSASSSSIRPRMFWLEPCEAMFEYLATHEPEALIEQLTSGALEPSALTFAAEWAGRTGSPAATAVLVALLEHPSALVREGAVYGLQHLLAGPGVVAALRAHATEARERSAAVREAVREALQLIP